MDQNNDIFVILRSVRERTEQASFGLLQQLFPAKNIEIIQQTPFSKMLRNAFDIAMDRNLPWSLCLDADVLIDVERFPTLIQKARKMDTRVFQIQGMILDKFFMVWKPSGAHIYRTSLLKKAIRHIPEDGQSLRPETDMFMKMSALGYPWIQTDIRIGVHDFEQYYEDVFRKCFFHGIKHRSFISAIEPIWRGKAKNDFDYELALIASQKGKAYEGKFSIDKSFAQDEYSKLVIEMGIREKPALTVDTYDHINQFVEDAKSNHSPDLQNRLFPTENFRELYDIKRENKARKINSIKEFFIRRTPHLYSLVKNIFKRLSRSLPKQ